MPFEYESLVGHLYVVGGRSISAAPPGALVEVAPQKAARIRETDTFYVLVLPSGDIVAATSFYEKLAKMATEIYFNSGGSVTSGLREVFNQLNNNLVEHNHSHENTYEANIICAILRGNDLIIGRVGSCVALMLNEGTLRTFPEKLEDDESLYIEPLGVRPIPNVKLMQSHVGNGTRIVFGDVNLAELNSDQINNTMMLANFGNVIVGFKELARLQMTMMAIEFIPPDVNSGSAIPDGQSTAEIADKVRAESRTRDSDSVTASTRSKPPRREKKPNRITPLLKKFLGFGALFLSRTLSLLDNVLDRFFGLTEAGKWTTSPIGMGAVFLLPIIVVGFVVILWLSGMGKGAVDVCIQELQERVDLAHSPVVVNGDRNTVINAWQLVLTKVEECDYMDPENAALETIKREGLEIIDIQNRITRYEVDVIDTLPEASIKQMVIQGHNLYVLDEANILVYVITLEDNGTETARRRSPIAEMRPGGIASNIKVGEIFAIAFNEDENMIVALDRDGVLVECSQHFMRCRGRSLLGAENWVNPVSITIWNGILYILDTGIGNGQIWRYRPSSGIYNSAPTEYFDGATRPQIRNAIDFEIDRDGSVYVLLEQGIVLKYNNGQPQTFDYAAFPEGQTITSAMSMFLDDRVISQQIYIVNRDNRTIYETTLIGTFDSSYRIFDEEQFDLLTVVTVADGAGGQELIYAASGNTVFVIEKED
jgi:hypothetical protein